METGERFIPMRLFKGVFIPTCIASHKTLTANDKLVWGQLNNHAGTNGVCYPKQTLLAEELGISERTVRTSIQNLIDYKFIAVEKATGVQRRMHYSTQYYFIWNEDYEVGLRPEKVAAPQPEILAGLQPEKVAGANNRLIEKGNKEKLVRPVRPEKKTILFLERFTEIYQSNKEFQSIWECFVQHRKVDKRKPLSNQAVTIIVNEINKFCPNDVTHAIAQIQYAIKSGNLAPNFQYAPWLQKEMEQTKPIKKQEEVPTKRKFYICDPHGRD